MTKRKLGNSDLMITPVGFGAWAIGGSGWEFAWGEQDDNDSVKAIHKALDMGVNWIDTAAVYGTGHSEEVVAKALDEYSGEKPYIFTKCALRWDSEGNISRVLDPVSIREECEDSLRRLKTNVIDLYQIHWPPPKNDDEIEPAWDMMAKLQEEGKVRWIGLSNFNIDQIKIAQGVANVTSLQPPYNLVNRAVEDEILPYCYEQGIGTIVYSPMMSGLLTGKMTKERAANLPDDDWRKDNPEFNEPKLSKNLKLVDTLKKIGKARDKSPGEIAIAWTLANRAVTGAIVGARNADQAEGVMNAAEVNLNENEISTLGSVLGK